MKHVLKVLVCVSMLVSFSSLAESSGGNARSGDRDPNSSSRPTGNNFNRGDYICIKQGTNRACALHVRDRYCRRTWSEREDGDPMYRCEVYIGLREPRRVNGRDYYCKAVGSNRVCAIHRRGGYCNYSWTEREDGNPMWRCQNFVNRN